MIQKFRYSLTVLAALFMAFEAIAQSSVGSNATKQSGQEAFCTALNQIIADYTNGFENIKGRQTGSHHLSKVILPGTVRAEIKYREYFGYFTEGTDDLSEAQKSFEQLRRNLESCSLPCRIRKTEEKEDGIDRIVRYRPVGAPQNFSIMQIGIHLTDYWWEGMDVTLRITQVKH